MNRHWALKLGDICEIVSGATPKTAVKAYWDGDIRWATPADLSDLAGPYLDDTPRKITAAGLASCSAKVLPPNSVLLSSRAPIGHVAINSAPMATNQGFKSLVPKEGLADAKFLYHWLKHNKAKIQALGNGATFKEVSKATVAEIGIDLPPLDEQRRIAAILDKADALRHKRKRAIALLDSLTQSIFLEMFGDPALNEHRYPIKTLGEVSEKFSDGPFGSNLKSEHYVTSGIRVVRLQNIGVGRFVDDDAAYVSETHFARLRKHECLPGDVLIGTLGDPNLRACVQPTTLPRALNKADCVQMRPDKKQILAPYASALLNLPSVMKMASGLVLGQTRARISMGRLRDLALPIAPISSQSQFLAALQNLAVTRAALTSSLESVSALFASLQHRAFSGQL